MCVKVPRWSAAVMAAMATGGASAWEAVIIVCPVIGVIIEGVESESEKPVQNDEESCDESCNVREVVTPA